MKGFLASFVLMAALTACSLPEGVYGASDGLIKVAVIDSGLNLQDRRFTNLCQTGHRNFTIDHATGTVDPNDTRDYNGHGTHVAGLIQKYAGQKGYCLLIYKFFDDQASGESNLRNEIAAIYEAAKEGASFVNISGGGPEFKDDEYIAIHANPQITFVVAAGNFRQNIDNPETGYYPASYRLRNEVVVGALDAYGNIANFSNYGNTVNAAELGVNVQSFFNDSVSLALMNGTSQATAIKTGKLVASRIALCHIGKINKERAKEGNKNESGYGLQND